MHRVVLVAVALVLVVAACGDADPEPDPDPTVAPTVAPTTATPTEDVTGDPEALAKADLAAHAGVDAAGIVVVEHVEVMWRDGSVGCPEPGEAYTQALVEGYRMVLRANGEAFSYHGARGKAPFRCDKPDPGGAVSVSADR